MAPALPTESKRAASPAQEKVRSPALALRAPATRRAAPRWLDFDVLVLDDTGPHNVIIANPIDTIGVYCFGLRDDGHARGRQHPPNHRCRLVLQSPRIGCDVGKEPSTIMAAIARTPSHVMTLTVSMATMLHSTLPAQNAIGFACLEASALTASPSLRKAVSRLEFVARLRARAKPWITLSPIFTSRRCRGRRLGCVFDRAAREHCWRCRSRW